MRGLQRLTRHLQDERGTLFRTCTFATERATELPRSNGAAVQANAVSGGTSGKPVAEEAAHVLGSDTDAVVDDRDAVKRLIAFDAQRQQFFLFTRLGAGVLGVADQVHENLQHLMLIDGNRRYRFELAAQV